MVIIVAGARSRLCRLFSFMRVYRIKLGIVVLAGPRSGILFSEAVHATHELDSLN